MLHYNLLGTRSGLLLLMFAAACTSSGGGGGGASASADVKSPFPLLSTKAKTTYVNTRPDGSSQTLYGEVAGSKDLGGKPFQRMVVARQAGTKEGSVEVWANPMGAGALELGGGEYTLASDSPLPLPAYASGTADTPVVVDLDPPVGAPQTFKIDGKGVTGDPNAEPTTGSIEGTYTLVEADVTVETPSGVVSGCKHFSVETALPDLFGADMPVEADVYAHPELGVVKAEMKSPLEGLGTGLSGVTDVSEIGGGLFSVQKLLVLGEGAASSFQLSTYDAHGDFDANKDVHAKMLLEVRWVDDAMAKTEQMPYVNQQFGTVLGTYPSTFVKSPVSYFFPAEKGYTHWIAFVDQAAKNESVNGIAYSISASYEPDFSPVRVAARIVYTQYAPGATSIPHVETDAGH